MFRFPLVEWLEGMFIKWVERPDDYREERWVFYKKLIGGSISFGIVLLIITKMYGISDVAVLVACGLLIIMWAMGKINKKERKERKHRWFHGEYSKWSILKLW